MKIVNYIKDKNHKVKSYLDTLHQRCKQPLKDFDSNTPYQIVSHWLLDVLIYGLATTVIWNTWLGWQGWKNFALIPANGIAVWLLHDQIRQIKESMKGK